MAVAKGILRRIQAWPWRVNFREYSQSGKLSRPQILDDNGKPVKLSGARQATLAAMAPILLDRLTKLAYKAEMMHLQVQSELAMNFPKPIEIIEAFDAICAAEKL